MATRWVVCAALLQVVASQEPVRLRFLPPLAYSRVAVQSKGPPQLDVYNPVPTFLSPVASQGYQLQRSSRQRPIKTFVISHGRRISSTHPDPEAMWPMGVFLPPDHDLQSILVAIDGNHNQRHFSQDDFEQDPYLVTGPEAKALVKYLFSRGELFFEDYPHHKAILRHNEERMANGLAGNHLGSNRPDSPFFRGNRRSSSLYED